MSAARRLVLEALFAAEGPVTADAIAAGLDGRLPSSDLASVYRNLDTLEQIGLVRHFHVAHGAGPLLARRPQPRRVRRVREVRRPPLARPRTVAQVAAVLREACGYEPSSSHFPIVGRCPEASAMHIPDGFLSPEVAAACAVPAVAAVGYGLRRASRDLDERRVPLLGVTAAFVFAAQMLNFPVAGGTSGHFLGAALAAVLLGPWLAAVVLSVVLVVQSFVFADGGVTALGANVLNMGVIGALVVGGLMLAAHRVLPNGRRTTLARGGRRRLAGGRRRLGRLRLRAGDLRDRAARHRAARDARRPRADRRRRGRDHRRRRERRPVHATRRASAPLPPAGGGMRWFHDPRAGDRRRPRRRRRAVRLGVAGRARARRRRQRLSRPTRSPATDRCATTRSRASTTRTWRPASPGFAGTLIVFAAGLGVARSVRR